MTKLALKNWKCHSEKTIELNYLNRFSGKNGEGKTAILEAIRFILTGDYVGTPVKNGTNEAVVSITFDDGTEVSRVLTSAGVECRINGKKNTGKAFMDVLTFELKTASRALDLATKVNMLDGAKEENLANYILSFLPQKITVNDVKEYGQVSDEAVDIYKDMFGDEDVAITELPKRVDIIKTSLKLTKKNLTAQMAIASNAAKSTWTQKQVDEQVEKCEAIGKALAARQEAQKIAMQSKTQRDKLVAMLAAKEKAIKENTSIKPDEKAVETAQKSLDEVRAQITDTKVKIAQKAAEASTAEETLKRLANSNTCPLCPQLVCSTDKKPLKDELTEKVAAAKKVVEGESNFLGIAKATEKRLMEDLKKMQDNEKLWNKKASLLSEIETLKESIKNIPELKIDETLEADVKNYNEKKKILEDFKAKFYAYQNALKAADEVKKLEKEKENLEQLTKALADNGPVIKAIIQKFLKVLSNSATKLGNEFGCKLVFTYDGNRANYLNIYADFGAGLVSYSNLSGGEKTIINVLFMGMLCSLNKSSILVIDEINCLDADNKAKMTNLLNSDYFEKNFKYIFVAGIE